MQLTPLSLIYLLAFSNALLIVGVLLKRSASGQPGRILAALMLVLAYKLLEGGIYYSSLYAQLPHLMDWLPASVLVIGPLFYAYVDRMSGSPNWSINRWLLHMLPAIIFFALNVPHLLLSAEIKINHVEQVKKIEEIVYFLPLIIAMLIGWKIHLSSYLYAAWQKLKLVEAESFHQFSDDRVICLGWQKKLCVMLILLEAVWVILFALQQAFGLTTLGFVDQAWLLFIATIILLMGYWGLPHPELMITSDAPAEKIQPIAVPASQSQSPRGENAGVHIAKSAEPNHQIELVKYATSQLDDDTAKAIEKAIINCFTQQSVHLNCGLSLAELAESIGIRHHLISQVINQHMQTSFFKLVNYYRVEHAKQMLNNPKVVFSLEQIAQQSGFNNRVTFNNAFKANEGISPSAYKKQLRLVS